MLLIINGIWVGQPIKVQSEAQEEMLEQHTNMVIFADI